MIFLKTLQDLKSFKSTYFGESVGFVPTMGALHQGHLELLQKARRENKVSVLSIYVNPTQFNQQSDFDNYPISIDADLKLAESIGVTAVFLPTYELIYPDGYLFKIVAPELTSVLCGKFRPGHFDGVLTVVHKLFQLIEPTMAYFGEKDYQQFQLIQRMTEAFYLKPKVIGVPTIREASGLALSSRNQRLSENGKKLAPLIYEALKKSHHLDEARMLLESNGFKVEYLEEHWGRCFVAAWIDGVRLIDNISIEQRGNL
jgi:pantoate--beta-alanine ligase